jgi:mannose-6-phosphate isomerase-like protein (cupin superfamily)
MADHCPTMTVSKLLADQLLDYSKYEQGLIKVIGHPDYKHSDCIVKDFFTFSQWIEQHKSYPVIKVEGLETDHAVSSCFNKINFKNIHLFVNQKFGYSFDWHKDDVNVLLHVIKGRKTVYIRNKKVILHPGQHVIIPRGHLHRVSSMQNTWALSVGY